MFQFREVSSLKVLQCDSAGCWLLEGLVPTLEVAIETTLVCLVFLWGPPPPTIIDGTGSQADLLATTSIEYKLFKGFIKADNPIQTNKSKSLLLHFVALIFPKQFPSRESHSKPKKKLYGLFSTKELLMEFGNMNFSLPYAMQFVHHYHKVLDQHHV